MAEEGAARTHDLQLSSLPPQAQPFGTWTCYTGHRLGTPLKHNTGPNSQPHFPSCHAAPMVPVPLPPDTRCDR